MFKELLPAFTSFTRSPIAGFGKELRRIAPFGYDAGGTVSGSSYIPTGDDFRIPHDIDAVQFAAAVHRFCPPRQGKAADLVRVTYDGRRVVPRFVVALAGSGNLNEGRRRLEQIVRDQRRGRERALLRDSRTPAPVQRPFHPPVPGFGRWP